MNDLELLIRLYDKLSDAGMLEEGLSQEVYHMVRGKMTCQIDDMTGPDPSYIDAVRWGVLDAIGELEPGLSEEIPGRDVEIVIQSLKERKK